MRQLAPGGLTSRASRHGADLIGLCPFRCRPGSNATIWAPAFDLATAVPEALRYKLFLGNVYLRGDGADFSAAWEWVPVLDFALSLKAIAEALDDAPAERFDFTESTAALDFRRDGNAVEIFSTYAPGDIAGAVLPIREQARGFSWDQ